MKPHHGEKQSEKSSRIKLGKDSGRVKVFVRVRPPRPQENSRKEPIAVTVEELSSQIHVSDPKHSWEKTFNFDHIFPKESTNPEVCSTISRPLVNAALNGFNGTLMAYGQTGSGKTHTLMAPDGITAGVIERCFKRITQDDRHDYKVTMSYLQIYQEKIYDLLNSTNKVELSLREHPVKGVYVENLSEFVVRSPAEVLSLLTVGKKRLVFAETKMNRNSSRSHSVCQLTIERTLNKSKAQTEGSSRPASRQARDLKDGQAVGGDKNSEVLENDEENNVAEEGADTEDDSLAKMVAFNDDVLIRGRIYLCDLAGSERLKKTQAEGERLSEAQHINSSLLELGNVIQALAEGKKTHVPFRNSTLTRLLQESLGGNCKTSLVVCVSPTMCDVSETKSALSFGSRAMKITNTAYINVEIDYQRLSEDLSKIVDMKEKDLEDLRQSYENRIERIKHEAETTVTNTMTEADRVVASVKSLYENQQSSLQREIESLNSRLEEERASAETLQGEMTSAKCKLQEDMFRARSTLLIDITSMQLFYAVKEVSFEDAPFLAEKEIELKDVNDGFIQSVAVATKSKVLENADVLLELFKGYLNLMNTKGEKLLENSKSLRFLVESEELFEEGTMLCGTEDESLYLTNKTDDDKVVASSRCNETPFDSRNEVIPSNEETPRDNDEFSCLRDKLVSLKNSIDGEALDFLKRAFEFDVENDSHPTNTRKEIYKRIQEFMDQRNPVLEAQKNPELQCQADALALLDHCHSHVIVDKALQSALLVLENNVITKRYHDIQKQKNVLEDENEGLRKQIQILKNEAEKLNGKLNETSTKLCDVKKSKEQLEDGLCSVFQLYNMSNSERNEEKEEAQKGISLSPDKLQAQFSTLVENNEKLQKELVVKEQEKENLQCELTSVKHELQREKKKHSQAQQDVKSTQTERIEHEESTNPSHGDHSVKFQDAELLHGILSALHDEYSSSLEKAASAAQTNDYADVSSLRTVINKRLGGEWSVLVLENAKMKSELDNIRARINEEKRSFVNELTTLQVNGSNEKALHVEEDGVLTDENTPQDDEVSDRGSDEPVLEIKIYDQNKVIAKLEMDKTEIVKGLQRYKADSNKSDDQNDKIESFSKAQNEDLPITKDDLGTIVKEKLQELSTVQQENKSLKNELDLLRDKYNSLERSYEESNKSRKSLEEKLENFVEGESNLCKEIVQLKEKCSKLDEHLVRSATDNNKLKEKLKELECKFYEAVQEKESIKEQKIALEQRLLQEQVDNERGLALEREQRNIHEKKCQEKTQEFEDERRLLNIKENCLSKVEKELAETKKSYKKLQECVNEHEKEKDNLMKEINSLRCLQGLPTIKRSPVNRGEVNLKQGVPQSHGGSINREKHVHNRKNNKLNSELTLAKEQLVRLKAELTLSNMQTRNLGTQLSSLREDSTKLEAELSTVRLSPKDSRNRRNSFNYYDETVRLELELGEAKERIIELQEKLLIIYKEKFALEEKVMSLEDQEKTEKQNAVLSAPLEENGNYKNATEALDSNTEKPCATQAPNNLDQEQGINLEQIKAFKNKIDLLEAEKAQLKRDLENTNADKSRLEGIEYWVQQLVTLEDEHLRLKSRLKLWAQNGGDEQQMSRINQDCTFSPIKVDSSNVTENSYLNDLKDLSAENVTLQEEANTLKETIAELQSDLAALKLKAAMKEGSQKNTLDKKAVATILISVKQERAELQQALDGVLIERNDLEEELAEIKMKYARLQREFAMTSIIKDDLELEILSQRKVNLSRGLSDLTQSSEEFKSERSDSSIDDLLFLGDDGAEFSSQERNVFDSAENTVQLKDERSIANPASDLQTKSSRSVVSSSKAKTNCSKKSLLPRPNNLQGLKSTTKKASGRRTLLSEPSGEKLRSTSSDRFDTDDNQSTTDTEQQHTAICYDLIRIDDVNDDAMHADADCSGLVRLTPKGEREKPEGMEQDDSTHNKIKNDNQGDNCDIILDDTDDGEEPWTSFPGIAGSDSLVVQSAEVLVKTAWSLKNIFRRQKSLPVPNQKHNTLKEL